MIAFIRSLNAKTISIKYKTWALNKSWKSPIPWADLDPISTTGVTRKYRMRWWCVAQQHERMQVDVVCGDSHTKNQLDPLRCTIHQRHKQTDTQPQRVVLAEPLPRSTNNIYQWSESAVCVFVSSCYSRPRFTCARFDYESAVQVFRLRTCMFNFS